MLKKIRGELRGRDARRYYLEQGLDKLSQAYEQMLGGTRLNYAICAHLVRLLREYEFGHPLAPIPEDLTPLYVSPTDTSVFAAIGPSSRIAKSDDFGKLATTAFARIFNINLGFLAEIWLPIRGYYAHGKYGLFKNRKKACATLVEFLESQYRDAEQFIELPETLTQIAERMREINFNGYDDLPRIDRDENIAAYRQNLQGLFKRIAESDSSSADPPSTKQP